MPVKLDILDELFASCHRNGRMPRFPKKPESFFFDAERFRWWVLHGARVHSGQLDAMLSRGCGVPRIRRWMDGLMKAEYGSIEAGKEALASTEQEHD